jgi:hypothetical protein
MADMLLSIVVAAEEAPAQLIMPNWAFAAIVAAFVVVLALITFSFRDVANRHADREPFPADPHDAHDDGHGAHDQAAHH